MSVAMAADHRIPQDLANTLALPASYADGRIHEAYRWLRAHQPLGVADVEGVDPFWVVTRHEDILEISRQNDLFHNGDRSPTIVSQEADQKVREMMGGSPHLLRTLIHMDEPDHLKYRLLTQAWFMPQPLFDTRHAGGVERVFQIKPEPFIVGHWGHGMILTLVNVLIKSRL